MSSARVCRARRLAASQRRGVLKEFFSRWPGDDRHRLGLGRAMFEFQERGIGTGRISAAGGSPWWSTVNGLLVGDVEDALDGARGPWADYVEMVDVGVAEAQARLWRAHQESIRVLYPHRHPCSADDVARLRGALDPQSLPTPIAGRGMTPGTP